VLAGFNGTKNVDSVLITIPHKAACVAHCSSLSSRAEIGVVNIMRRKPDGGRHGDNFDGPGFVKALRTVGIRSPESGPIAAHLPRRHAAGRAIALRPLHNRRDGNVEPIRYGPAALPGRNCANNTLTKVIRIRSCHGYWASIQHPSSIANCRFGYLASI
jgi:hypothetical protein